MESLITCVNYDDLLAITLPAAARSLRVWPWIITTPADEATEACAWRFGGKLFPTDAFHQNGAAFNKAAALNEIVASGRLDLSGWVMTLDADILLPERFGEVMRRELKLGCLHGARRLMCADLATWRSGGPFPPIKTPAQLPGFLHAFWAPSLEQPWYDESYEHAGAYDTAFQNRWPKERKRRFSSAVIHLGPLGQNWFGRRTGRWSGESTGAPDRQAVDRLHSRHESQRRRHVPVEGRKEAKVR